MEFVIIKGLALGEEIERTALLNYRKGFFPSSDLANICAYSDRNYRRSEFPATKVNLPIASQGIVVTAEYLHMQPRVVEGVLRALIEGLAFTVAPANKPLVFKTLTRKLGVTDPTALEEGYQEILIGLDRKPYPSLEGMKNIQRLAKIREPRLGSINVESIVDDS